MSNYLLLSVNDDVGSIIVSLLGVPAEFFSYAFTGMFYLSIKVMQHRWTNFYVFCR